MDETKEIIKLKRSARIAPFDIIILCLECRREARINNAKIEDRFCEDDNILCPQCKNQSIIATDGKKVFKKDKFMS